MPTETVTRPPNDSAILRRDAIDRQIDRARLDGMLAKHGPELIIQWIAEIQRDRRPRS